MLFSRFQQIGRTIGHVHRFRVVVHVFIKYGYQDVAQQLPLPWFWLWIRGRRFRRQQAEFGTLTRAQRLRLALEELGPAFVKLGQLLADRTGSLPREFTLELAKLHDRVPPVPFVEVQAVLASELPRSIPEDYASIDETPLAAASIAQVHCARLLDGSDAVIKVQRPNIERIVRVDLEIMVRVAELLENHVEGWHAHEPTAIVAEFARRMELELDFTAEVSAMERFARQFEGNATVRVPRVRRSLCSRRVLTMERIHGIPAERVTDLDAAGLDRGEIARRLADLTMRQVFIHGFFHADPHSGNVHVLAGNVICYLDFGMTGFLVQETRDHLAALFAGIAQQDERAATHALLLLAGAELDPPRPRLEGDVADFIHRHFTGAVRELVFVRLLQHLFQLTAEHALTLPPEVFTVVKALGQVEHLVSELSSEFDLLAQGRPFMQEIQAQRARPQQVLREFLDFGGEAMTALRSLPLEFRRVAAQLRDGKTRVNFRVEGLRPLDDTLERVTNRLAFSIVLAALIVASALIIHAGVAPTWHTISIIGLLGYAISGLMGMVLLISMIRHGRL